MQPSPIAETRGPVDPSCRVITRNPLYFEFLANLPNRSQVPPCGVGPSRETSSFQSAHLARPN
jgi:hypothetical protein